MILFLIRLFITTLVVVATAHVIPDLIIKNTFDAICFGIALGLINASVRPVLVLLTLPVTLFTLGIFLLVINAFTFWLASLVSYGVHISSLEGALIGGGIIWIVGLLTNRLIWNIDLY